MNLINPIPKQIFHTKKTAESPASYPYFYVGHNTDSIEQLVPFRNTADNYLSARTRLLRILESGGETPRMILLDMPFNRREVKSFIKWINHTYSLNTVPIIYNRSALKETQIEELSQMRIVDDIVDLTGNFDCLAPKADFLWQIKSYLVDQNSNFSNKIFKTASTNAVYKFNQGFKRAFDILISSFLILLLLPAFGIIALAIRLESRGPVIYTSNRAGQGFKVFRFFKFRTMVIDADKKVEELEKLNLYGLQDGKAKFFKIKNDPRITKVGAILRNTSLDELPQLFNVLLGDMSIVGNRPLPLYEASTLTTDEWAERFMAPAGITGLWQIKKRGKEDMSVEERISLDINYARNNNLLKDFWILANTPTALIQKTNV